MRDNAMRFAVEILELEPRLDSLGPDALARRLE